MRNKRINKSHTEKLASEFDKPIGTDHYGRLCIGHELTPTTTNENTGIPSRDDEIWCEELQLKKRDILLLEGDFWLNDNLINAAMRLMKSAIEKEKAKRLNGLTDVIIAPIYGFDKTEKNSNFVQIINIRNNHWICLSNVFASSGAEVIVYDSKHELSLTSKGIKYPISVAEIACEFLVPKEKLLITVASVQQQIGCDDCGLFAIVFAALLVENENPVGKKFDHFRMRASFLSSLPTCRAPGRDAKVSFFNVFGMTQ